MKKRIVAIAEAYPISNLVEFVEPKSIKWVTIVWPEYSTEGKPNKAIDTVAIPRALVICITAPNINCDFICGKVIYHSSCQRFFKPSIAAASYKVRSTV